MQNIISLDHNDIDTAISSYIAAHGVTLDGKNIDIKFVQGRGAHGVNTATVTVSNKLTSSGPGEDAPAKKSSNDQQETQVSQAKKPAVIEESTKTNETAEEEVEDQPAITKESIIVESETEDDGEAVEPDDTKSLFATS